MADFTPGPLEVRLGDGEYFIIDNNDELVGTASGQNQETDEANAYLFAAAPEMYEALNGIINSLPDTMFEWAPDIMFEWAYDGPLDNTNIGVIKHWRYKCITALAKARGET